MTRRIAAAQVIGTLGGGLVVATVVRLLQVGQEILPYWWPWPVVIGGILFIGALLLLVPPEWWRWIAKLLKNAPRNIKTSYWLQSVLHSNNEKVYESVKSHFLTGAYANAWDFQGLTNNPLDPYFQINLELINTSIFDFCVSGIEGKMVVDGSTCQKDAVVDRRCGIKQGDAFPVSIRQPVPDFMLKRIQDAIRNKEELKFDLHSMFLILETTTKGYEGTKVRIKFMVYSILPS